MDTDAQPDLHVKYVDLDLGLGLCNICRGPLCFGSL